MEERKYFNEMLARLEEIFYHELSGCARPKVEFVGTDFLKDKTIEGKTAEQVIDKCIEVIKKTGLVKDLTYSLHGFGIFLRVKAKGCIHLSKESMLKKEGIEPYTCPIANMILDRLIEILNYETTYTAKLHVDEQAGECVMKCAIYETVEKIGQVSDWTKF